MATTSPTIEHLQEPKKRKRRRLRVKKLNPFRRKYKKFSEDITKDNTRQRSDSNDETKKKRKSRARDWLHTAVGIITFRSHRKRRASSNPVTSSYRARRGSYGSTGSLECLMTRDFAGSDSELHQKAKLRKRAWSDPCLYGASENVKKKKSKTKRVKKASVRAAKLMGNGLVQVAGAWQFASPVAGLPSAIHQRQQSKQKATYYDDERRRHRDYSSMMYTFG